MQCVISLFCLLLLVGGNALASHQDAYQPQEAHALSKSGGLAVRHSDTLSLTLNDGKTLDLTNSEPCDDPDPCHEYFYEGLVASNQFFLVVKGLWEGSNTLLISRKSGSMVDIYGEPHLSPNGRLIAAPNTSESYNPNGVFLWEIVDGEVVARFDYQPDSYEFYAFDRWVGNDKLILKRYRHVDPPRCKAEHPFELSRVDLVRHGNTWALQETSAPRRCVPDWE